AFLARITPGYFATLGISMIGGRDFNDHDAPQSPKVAIVNEMFGRKFLNGANPLGKTFRLEEGKGEPEPTYEIVGVVKDTKYYDLRESNRPLAFFPQSQNSKPSADAQIHTRSNLPL